MGEDEFLVVSFPSQGHINPSLELAKRLLRAGASVTFATAVSTLKQMSNNNSESELLPQGLSYVAFSDGYDEGFKPGGGRDKFMAEMKRVGSKTLRDLILLQSNKSKSNDKRRRPFTHVFYSMIIPWVGEVAHSLGLPSTLLWCQPATVLDIYYFYHFGGYADAITDMFNTTAAHTDVLQLPAAAGLPSLRARDLPSFFAPGNPHAYALPLMKWHIDVVSKGNSNTKVLINSFDALEEGPLQAVIGNLKMVPIGPLLPSAFLDEDHGDEVSFGGDLFEGCSRDYIKWLDAKPKASVIYVASGTISGLSKRQKGEILQGLVASRRPFLWVITITEEDEDLELEEDGDGMIVKWCSQVEVLSHPSVGCFLTHCGWNSTLESLTCGVPMVAVPQWSDQHTNSKLVEDVWKVGVRASENEEEGIVEADEIARCLELVMGDGDKGEMVRANANKWQVSAREAAKEGGSSYRNLKSFLDEITTSP